MAEAIKINAKLFQERVAHFINVWKADKRSGDALFGGVSSIVVMMGKVEEVQSFNKNNAMHVRYFTSRLTLATNHAQDANFSPLPQFWLLGYEFPTTLMLFTLDTLYILTTAKKGAPSKQSHSRVVIQH